MPKSKMKTYTSSGLGGIGIYKQRNSLENSMIVTSERSESSTY